MSSDLSPYLQPSPIIDFDHPDVATLARKLAAGKTSDNDITKACFEFVRDRIAHSVDAKMNPVTCRASDVLHEGHGYCYAKSHLLAALLRANQLPAALCYQRLSIDDKGPPFCLHGLNAVFLKAFGWYRLDARGNKPGIEAGFDPPQEVLAFTPKLEGERDLPDLHAEPLPEVLAALSSYKSWKALQENLPDVGGLG
ncbi:MAG: transglutaminase family protein [Alphaproteobacteria bacterium]|nr:transglutaminase family protein [Alphaproteobacteria bacterium]